MRIRSAHLGMTRETRILVQRYFVAVYDYARTADSKSYWKGVTKHFSKIINWRKNAINIVRYFKAFQNN